PFREAMKAVEDKADIRMVGPPYDLPRIAMVADMLAPGQGFVADAKATPPRPFTKLPEIVGGAIHATEREGRHIRADEEKVGAELLHDVELALGAVESALPVGSGHALEVAEGLEEADLEPVVAYHAADIRRTAIECKKVALEDLDAVETGLG